VTHNRLSAKSRLRSIVDFAPIDHLLTAVGLSKRCKNRNLAMTASRFSPPWRDANFDTAIKSDPATRR
jgi:hypothetical protein